jgi:protein-tyrosine kinase
VERSTRTLEQLRTVQEVAAGALKTDASLRSHSIHTPLEFGDTTIFKTPVVRLDAAQRERERILPPNAAGPLGAAYKMLRTQVLYRLDKLHANTLAIVSPTAGAGKTLTTINLAIAIAAEMGRTALLVDLDLRNPCVAKRFGLNVEVGIEDCLMSRRPVQDAMVKIADYDRLTMLPARARVEHSSELLTDRRTAEVIAELRTRYANRIVIFDLPPVLQADDALAVSRHLQAGLVVVGERRSRRDDVARTLELLHDTTMVGTVLNGSRDPTSAYY